MTFKVSVPAVTSDRSWHIGRCAGVDSVIPDKQDATSHIQWSAIQQAAASVWCSAGFHTGAAAVPSVHC